jgi:hypothetical protein
MSTRGSYSDQWKRFRQVRTAAILSLLFFFRAVLFVAVLIRKTGASEYAGLVADVALVIAVVYAGLRYATWPCPRCGRSFRRTRETRASIALYRSGAAQLANKRMARADGPPDNFVTSGFMSMNPATRIGTRKPRKGRSYKGHLLA